jgi:hypothetical protein
MIVLLIGSFIFFLGVLEFFTTFEYEQVYLDNNKRVQMSP